MPRLPFRTLLGACALLPLGLAPALAQSPPGGVEEIVVTGRRSGVPAYERPFGPTVIGGEALETAPQRRLDEALRSVPGFGLFRRTGSRIAQPTTQGVSLRGIGPNGAGRTLVLVDGVPVNDPFGGWVYWSRLPTDAVERVVITRGGGAGPWGNAALAGTVRIETRPPAGAFGEVSAGSQQTYQATGGFGGASGGFDLGLSAGAFTTGGHSVVRGDRRGPIDLRAGSDALWLDTQASTDLGGVRATAKLSAFREHRDNGTPYTENATDALEGSLRLVGGGRFPWEAVLYARDWDFRSTFSGVNADRTAETPALDQYSVPSRAYGGVVQVGLPLAAGHQTDVGVDVRWAEGTTNEFFLFQNGAFTRDRAAGGEQLIAGAFAEHAWTPDPALAVTAGLRVDRWENSGGLRREVNILNGQMLVDEAFPTRRGTVVNGRIGADWQALPEVGLRVAGYTGFRLPTLNELYRPFRVGNDITEANPALNPEELRGAEVGIRYTPGPTARLSLTAFRAEVRDAVDNVELTRTPGNFAPLGIFVPAGGSLAQRRNLDRVVVNGLEAEAEVQPVDTLALSLSYLFSHAEIRSAEGFPALVGNRPGQTPRHQGTAEASWRPLEPALLRLQLRAASRAFEGSENAQTLAGYTVADLYAGWDLRPGLQLFATVENLTDREVQTGARADGLINVGPGRSWSVGLRGRW